MKKLLSLILILLIACTAALAEADAPAEPFPAPTPDELTNDYFLVIAGIEQGTAGASLKQAEAVAQVASFAIGHSLYNTDIPALRENLLTAWEGLSDETRAAFDANFIPAVELVSACCDDFDANRGAFDDAGVAETMEMLVYDPLNRLAWDNLVANTLTMGNSDGEEAARIYDGIDPWGNPLRVVVFSLDDTALTGTWIQNFDAQLFTAALDCPLTDGAAEFAIQGPVGDSDYMTCRYTGTIAVDGEDLTVTFTDGEMTSESTEGGSTSHHVAALDDAQRVVTLVPGRESDYTVATSLDAAVVEAFAARVRDLYLRADWDSLAELISYPIVMYPDVEIADAAAFTAFMDGKSMAEGDVEIMRAETCQGMFANYQGICLGSGQIWLSGIVTDDGEQTDECPLRVIAVSGLAD